MTKENLGSAFEFLLPRLNELLNGKYVSGFCGLDKTERIENITYSPDNRAYNIHTVDTATGKRDTKSLACVSGLDLLAESDSSSPSKSTSKKIPVSGHLPTITLSEDIQKIIKNEKNPTQNPGRLAPSPLFKTELTNEQLAGECRSYAERPDPD